jgi:hypothetical protein
METVKGRVGHALFLVFPLALLLSRAEPLRVCAFALFVRAFVLWRSQFPSALMFLYRTGRTGQAERRNGSVTKFIISKFIRHIVYK